MPLKGAHSPGPRVVSKGVYNIQNVKSQILGQEEVSLNTKCKNMLNVFFYFLFFFVEIVKHVIIGNNFLSALLENILFSIHISFCMKARKMLFYLN